MLQQAPEPPAEAEAEAEAAEAAEAASSSSAPSELSYIEEQKQKFSGKSADVAPRTEVTIATPAFFGKREEERPGDARGQGGLNEQGYEPYDPSALDSSTVDTKPVFAALAFALFAAAGFSVKNQIGF